MAIPVWPTSLPERFDASDYDEEEANNILRSETDMGPAMVRKRTSANVRPVVGSMYLTTAQRATLISFYRDDCQSGSIRFSWVDQITGDALEYRFKEPPKFGAVTSSLHTVSLELEVMP